MGDSVRGDGVSVDPEELTSCSTALNQANLEAASGLQGSRSDAESAGAGFPADLEGPFAAVNDHFNQADSKILDYVTSAAARVLEASESYCTVDSGNADLLTGAADGLR